MAAALALAALFAAHTSAASSGRRAADPPDMSIFRATPQIQIRGAEVSSHLRLTVSGDSLVVDGDMDRAQPVGCRFTHGHNEARCPLAGAGSIKVVTGPGKDKVDVLDPLPVPLSVYLGDGSDGFHGNTEPDNCHGQGTKMNRCITGGGNDVCITGQQNSDCFMGPGNDYCRHGAGSDGCWGGPGNDVCHMGPGMDGCHGGPGNDRLYGGPDADRLFGGPGHDYCDGEADAGRSYDCEAGPGH